MVYQVFKINKESQFLNNKYRNGEFWAITQMTQDRPPDRREE